jgi:hypothetical protein
MRIRTLISLTAFALCFMACESVIPEPPVGEVLEDPEDPDNLIIVDRTGKKWDVTHAFHAYGMDPLEFQFGLGPHAIRPLIEPRLLLPGEPGYPGPNDGRLVIGVKLNGESRAYNIGVLDAHEVVDERYGDVHVAVGW